MTINNKKIKGLSLALVLSMFGSNIAYAGNINKTETVYVDLDSTGGKQEVISSIWLNSDENLKNIKDRSILENLKNVKGDENPEISNDDLVWNVEEKDLYYQGNTNKELPIEYRIKYYLDQEEVLPEDIAGKNGNIKIVVKIINNDQREIQLENGENKKVYTPYLVATMIDLDTNIFKNINSTTGKIISDGDSERIAFVTIPGLKSSMGIDGNLLELDEEIIITADVEEFEMKPILGIVTTEIPDADIDIENLDSLDELMSGLDKLNEAGSALTEATEALYSGQVEMGQGIDEFITGVDALNIGTRELLEGSSKLMMGLEAAYDGSSKVSDGTKQLSQSAEMLGDSYVKMGSGLKEFSENSQKFSNGAKELSMGVKAIPENADKMNQGLNGLIEGTGKIEQGQVQLTDGLKESTEALNKLKQGKEKEKNITSVLYSGIENIESGLISLKEKTGIESFDKLIEGTSKQKEGLGGLLNSSDEMILAIEQLEEGLLKAQKSSEQLSNELAKVNGGQKELSQGLTKLSEGSKVIAAAGNELSTGSEALNVGAEKIRENSEQLYDGSIKFKDGSKDLIHGQNEIENGLKELSVGSKGLNAGIEELSSGTNQLANGAHKIKDGNLAISEGSKELNEGMIKFNDEGLSKISNELDGSDLDIVKTLEIKDELVKLSKENNSFTGISDDMDGDLKFIYKTSSIKNEKHIEEEIDTEEEVKENGFIKWLKGLFDIEN